MLQRVAIGATWDQAGHDVDARAVQCLGVFQRLNEAVPEFGFAPGQAGQPAFAGIPVAGRRVEQHLLQAVVCEPLRQLAGVEGVGKEEFDGLKAIGSGGGKPVQKRMLVVEHAEVGGKVGHGLGEWATSARRSACAVR